MSAVRLEAAFASEETLLAALAELRRAGFAEGALEVRSSIPLAAERLPGLKRRSSVLPAAIAGGLLGGSGAWLLIRLSVGAYPLLTGGMPLMPVPPTAIVVYEGTALGVILATVAAVLVEGRLLRRWRGGGLDHRLADGDLLLAVDCADAAAVDKARPALAGSEELLENRLG